MGNILYGDLGSEHMIYIADSKLENVIRTLYASCETLTAGYYYTMGNGIWSYAHKYNARHAGYISAYSSAEADSPGTRFDEIKFSKKGEFECKDHKGSLSLPVNQKYKMDKNTAVNIVYQMFSDMADRKTVYLYMSDSNLSTSGCMIQGLRICNTIISAFPAVIQKYISYMSNSFPNKKNTLKVHIMFLQKNYKELYAKEWSRSFQYKVIDCSEEKTLPRRISKYVEYLSDVISGKIEKNVELDPFFECVNCRKMEKGEIDMSIFDTIYSLYYFSRSESKDTDNFKKLWLKLQETDNSCNIEKLEQLLGEDTAEIIKSFTDESETEILNEIKEILNNNEQSEENSLEIDESELVMPTSRSSKEPKSTDENKTDQTASENKEAVSNNRVQSMENDAETEADTETELIMPTVKKKQESSSTYLEKDKNESTAATDKFSECQLHEELKAENVKPEKKASADVAFKRTDCHQNEWLDFLSIFSKAIKIYRQNSSEKIEEMELITNLLKNDYAPTNNRPGKEVAFIEVSKEEIRKKEMRGYIYKEYENAIFLDDYRVAETFAIGLFIRYGHKKWIKNQSISELKLVGKCGVFASLGVDDASYIFFLSIYIYYEMHSKSVFGDKPEYKDFAYEYIFNEINSKLNSKLKDKSKIFEDEERRDFFDGEDSYQKKYFLIYFSLCLIKLVIQCDADIYDSNIKRMERKKRKEVREKIAEKCKIQQYRDFVFNYINDMHNDKTIKTCLERCIEAMELKDFLS